MKNTFVKNNGMKVVVSFLALTIGGLATSAQAQQKPSGQKAGVVLKFEAINAPGAYETQAYTINNKNEVAGDYTNAAGLQQGMLLKGKKLTSVSCPTGGAAVVAGVDLQGTGVVDCAEAVGGYKPEDDGDDIYEFFDGHLIRVPVGECPQCVLSPITIVDFIDPQIVGEYGDAQGLEHGFVFDAQTGAFESLDVPGGTNTLAWGINNGGSITLQAADPASGLVHSYLYNGNSYTQIDVPGALQSFAHGINNNGDIVYSFLDANNNSHGALFLASTGMFVTFDDPNGTNVTQAYGINDEIAGKTSSKLKIVGDYSLPGSTQNNAFEATVTVKP